MLLALTAPLDSSLRDAHVPLLTTVALVVVAVVVLACGVRTTCPHLRTATRCEAGPARGFVEPRARSGSGREATS